MAADPAEQADCYAAMYEVFSRETSWMKGPFWWAWDVSPPGAGDTGYNPRGKPAEDVLRQWQKLVIPRGSVAVSRDPPPADPSTPDPVRRSSG